MTWIKKSFCKWIKSLLLSSRVHEVRAVLSRPHCSAVYPPEWGRESWRFSGCHTSKHCSPVWQSHFSLHRIFTWNHYCFLSVLLLVHLCFHLVWFFIAQAQRVPARKQHMEAHGGPTGQLQNCCSVVFWNQAPVFFNLTLAVMSSAVELKETKWTPQRVRSTRRHPMSAMVSKCVMHVLMLSVWCKLVSQSLPYLGMLLFSEMASVSTTVTVCHHTRPTKQQNKPTTMPGSENNKPRNNLYILI